MLREAEEVPSEERAGRPLPGEPDSGVSEGGEWHPLDTLAYEEAKNSFTLPGIGKLVLVQRQARMGRNPATGETIHIPAKKVVKFRVAKAAKDAILG